MFGERRTSGAFALLLSVDFKVVNRMKKSENASLFPFQRTHTVRFLRTLTTDSRSMSRKRRAILDGKIYGLLFSIMMFCLCLSTYRTESTACLNYADR
jgi:hypothetical protein